MGTGEERRAREIGDVVNIVGRKGEWTIREIYTPSDGESERLYSVAADDGKTTLIVESGILRRRRWSSTVMQSELPGEIIEDLRAATTADETDLIYASAYAAGWTLRSIGYAVDLSGERIRQRVIRHSQSVPDTPLRPYAGPDAA